MTLLSGNEHDLLRTGRHAAGRDCQQREKEKSTIA
jgi:hypothetical protein